MPQISHNYWLYLLLEEEVSWVTQDCLAV